MKLKLIILSVTLSYGVFSKAQYVDKAIFADYNNISSEEAYIYYSLPKTVIEITVFYSQTNEKSGPYSQFTEEMLGINEVIKTNNTYWKIDSFMIGNHTEPDLNQLVGIKPGRKFEMRFLQPLANKGFILNPQVIDFKQNTQNNLLENKLANIPELLRKPIIRPTTDTTFRTVIRDSVTHRLPIVKNVTAAVSLHDRAKDAAQDIYKMRQRKYELIMGEDEPQSSKRMFNERLKALDAMERSYLELFVGETSKTTYQTTFYFTPSDNTASDTSKTLFCFDEASGISDDNYGTAFKLQMNIAKQNENSSQSKILLKDKNVVYYKIPGIATVSVLGKDKTYIKDFVPVYQLGKTIPFIMVP